MERSLKAAPKVPGEEARLASLLALEVLDTPPEPALDDLTKLASIVCEVPMALVSLIDDKRQWFKSRVGLRDPETPRDISFCGHAIAQSGMFVVEDAHEDPRFFDNPLVVSDPKIRFYAGAPLDLGQGAIGALCILDRAPRKLDDKTRAALDLIARQVLVLLGERRRGRETEMARALLDEAQEIAHVGSWEWKLRDNQVMWSRELRRMYGVDPDFKPTFEGFMERIHADDRTAVRRAFEVALTRGTSPTLDHRVLRPDGSIRVLLGRGRPVRNGAGEIVRLVGTALDVTELREAQAALALSEARARALVDALPDVTLRLDRDGIVRDAHLPRGFSTAKREDLVGKPLRAIVSPAAAELLDLAITRVRAGSELELVDYQAHFPTEVRDREARLVAGADGEVIMIARDTTERRAVDRMKDEIVATVSHELRTPLTAIRGALGILVTGALGEIPEEAMEMLTIASGSAERLVRLVNDVLDVSKLEAGKVELSIGEIDARTLVDDTLASLRPFASAAAITLVGDVTSFPIEGDQDRLIQVLTNLVANAIKFSPPSAPVTIRVERRGAVAHFRVSDRGPGVPEEHRAALFARFRQIVSPERRKLGGTGLGLSIARAIVELHGGSIGIADEGPGATFWFEVPLRAREPNG